MDKSRQIAKDLLSIKAVFLRPDEPFTWASGIKSPIYCDNRLTLSFPEVRAHVEQGLAELIKKNYPSCEALFGTATAGIAHAALTADLLGLPMGYVRSSSKDHGRANRIEGMVVQQQNVVVVEDLISTAGSSVESAAALTEAGFNVLGIVSIFTYRLEKGVKRLKEAGLVNHSLCDLDTLVDVAAAEGYIKENDVERILKFRSAPDDPSWM